MFFPNILVLALASVALSLPTGEQQRLEPRDGLLKKQAFAQFQISDGVAGNALAEVNKKFPIKVASASPADLAIIKEARETAEKAEVKGFDPAIAKASGKEKTELENGKIKNKVLKLQLEVEALEIEQAQGNKNLQSKVDAEKKKLAENVALDKKAAGQKSKGVNFTG